MLGSLPLFVTSVLIYANLCVALLSFHLVGQSRSPSVFYVVVSFPLSVPRFIPVCFPF